MIGSLRVKYVFHRDRKECIQKIFFFLFLHQNTHWAYPHGIFKCKKITKQYPKLSPKLSLVQGKTCIHQKHTIDDFHLVNRSDHYSLVMTFASIISIHSLLDLVFSWQTRALDKRDIQTNIFFLFFFLHENLFWGSKFWQGNQYLRFTSNP